jgi:hypothetical protein
MKSVAWFFPFPLSFCVSWTFTALRATSQLKQNSTSLYWWVEVRCCITASDLSSLVMTRVVFSLTGGISNAMSKALL